MGVISSTFGAAKVGSGFCPEKHRANFRFPKKQKEHPDVHKYLKMSKRLPYLLQLLESSPTDSFVLFAIAKEYENAADPAQALSYYKKLHDTDPAYVGLYYHLGKLYEQQQDAGNAISTYKQGIEVARKVSDFHALSELQGALLNLEDPEE